MFHGFAPGPGDFLRLKLSSLACIKTYIKTCKLLHFRGLKWVLQTMQSSTLDFEGFITRIICNSI